MIDFTTDAEHNRLLPSCERRKEVLSEQAMCILRAI